MLLSVGKGMRPYICLGQVGLKSVSSMDFLCILFINQVMFVSLDMNYVCIILVNDVFFIGYEDVYMFLEWA